jgi:Cu(I)/Ag(I) efflux system membrane fusion protein
MRFKSEAMKGNYFKITGISILLLLVVLLAAATFIRYIASDSDEKAPVSETKKQYVCSMHPQVIRDAPGDCPICGMFLIEKIEQDGNSYDSSLTDIVGSVNKSVLSSVMTVTPEQTSLPLVIEATGIINYDPRKIQTISARFGGLIEQSFVKYQFQHIKKGQKIYEIFCPDIYTEQWNYVKLVQAYPDRDDLAREALEWLNLLGLSKGQIDSLKRAPKPDYHLAVYSSAEGYAVNRDFDPESFFFTGVREERDPAASLAGAGSVGLNDGISIATGEPLFKVIDVRALRVDLKVKTDVGSLLKRGQKVIVTDAANPDRQYGASIDQIEPLNGGLFQTVKVYITDNEKLLLPGRQIKAQIITGNRDGLWVPVSAVLDLGQRKTVFVLDGNKFVATEIITGVRSDDKIEIIWGIDKNAKIAEKALLLIDSDGFIASY